MITFSDERREKITEHSKYTNDMELNMNLLFKILTDLGTGAVEISYRNSSRIELGNATISKKLGKYVTQFTICFRHICIGEFYIEPCIIVELDLYYDTPENILSSIEHATEKLISYVKSVEV